MKAKRRIYLDHAAAAPVTPTARKAFLTALKLKGNPSSPHAEGRAARAALEEARLRIARLAGVKQDAVIFTGGATEANALAIRGRILALARAGRAPQSMHVLYLPSVHASTHEALEELATNGVRIEALSVRNGAIDQVRLAEQLTPETVLLALDVVCGETGAFYKVRDVRRALDAHRKAGGAKVTLHADASQAPYVESLELSHLGADTVTLDAQKIGGVRGIGVLIAPRAVELAPLIRGGGQERGLRPGTESAALAAACAAALEEAQAAHDSFSARATTLRYTLLTRLRELQRMEVNEGKENAPHILNLSLLGRDTDYLAALLDEAGFAVSTKSACETDSRGSRAVLMQTGDAACAESTLRISWGPKTTKKELEAFAAALIGAVRFMDANAI